MALRSGAAGAAPPPKASAEGPAAACAACAGCAPNRLGVLAGCAPKRLGVLAGCAPKRLGVLAGCAPKRLGVLAGWEVANENGEAAALEAGAPNAADRRGQRAADKVGLDVVGSPARLALEQHCTSVPSLSPPRSHASLPGVDTAPGTAPNSGVLCEGRSVVAAAEDAAPNENPPPPPPCTQTEHSGARSPAHA